jgi:FAD/FMN-containing dehydrogenase
VSVAAKGLREALVEHLGDEARVSDGESERDLHSEDLSFHRPHRPDLVVYPTSTEAVSRVLAFANERRIPVGDLVPLMREIKRVFDPHGIMNPGKVFTLERSVDAG